MNGMGLGDRWREKKLVMDFLWDAKFSRIGELSLFGFIITIINKIIFSMRTFLQISYLSVIKETAFKVIQHCSLCIADFTAQWIMYH